MSLQSGSNTQLNSKSAYAVRRSAKHASNVNGSCAKRRSGSNERHKKTVMPGEQLGQGRDVKRLGLRMTGNGRNSLNDKVIRRVRLPS